MLGGVRLPADQEGRGQRHRSFFEEGPHATGVHGEAQGDKSLTGQWLLGGGVLATLGGESPQVFAVVTTAVGLFTAHGWHRPGPPSLFLTQRPLTPAQLCTPRDTHGEYTHACSCAYIQLPHQKDSSQLEQRPYPDMELRRWWTPPRWVSREDPHAEGLSTAGRPLPQASLSPGGQGPAVAELPPCLAVP